VEEGDPSAAFLFVAEGDYYDEDMAREMGWPPETQDAITERIDMGEVMRKAQVEPEGKALHEPPETKARKGPRLIKKRDG
jgi:hypothetical protein